MNHLNIDSFHLYTATDRQTDSPVKHPEMQQKTKEGNGRDEKVCSLWLIFTCTEGKLIDNEWLYSCPLVLLANIGWKVDKGVGKSRSYVGGNW